MEDILEGFRNPSVIDLKMGKQSYEPNAPESKKQVSFSILLAFFFLISFDILLLHFRLNTHHALSTFPFWSDFHQVGHFQNLQIIFISEYNQFWQILQF